MPDEQQFDHQGFSVSVVRFLLQYFVLVLSVFWHFLRSVAEVILEIEFPSDLVAHCIRRYFKHYSTLRFYEQLHFV